jgi:hypothetical protein
MPFLTLVLEGQLSNERTQNQNILPGVFLFIATKGRYINDNMQQTVQNGCIIHMFERFQKTI